MPRNTYDEDLRKCLDMDLAEEEEELNAALRRQIEWFEHIQVAMAELTSRNLRVRGELQAELQSLSRTEQGLNHEFATNSQRLVSHSKLCEGVVQWGLRQSPSPRSSSALARLNALEETVSGMESHVFALVPLTTRVETKTKLAVMVGEIEKVQDKHVDAIQAEGLGCKQVVATRRRALVKRLHILAALVKTLHKISSEYSRA